MDATDIAEVDRFAVPKDTLGLHVLREPQGLKPDEFAVDVVAVHGLGGDSFATWTDEDSKQLWLKDFLPISPFFRGARIMTFGYDARPWLRPGGDPATEGRAFTFAESLVGALKTKRTLTGTEGRPILFVGHSLGGIVIKLALVYSCNRQFLYRDIYESAKSIAFFGTPHQGANIATWSGYLESIAKVVGVTRTAALEGLETWSPSLLELQRTFSGQVPRLIITSFWEKQPYNGVNVVNEGSASLSSFNEVFIGLDANHRTICKFASEDSSVYRDVVQNLEAMIHGIQHPPEGVGTATTVRARDAVSDVQLPRSARDPSEGPEFPPVPSARIGQSSAGPIETTSLEERMRALRE